MKLKNIVLGIALFSSCIIFAQSKGDISAFAGVTYPLATGSEFGANVGLEYMVTDEIGAAPSYSYYFYPSGLSVSAINVDVRYYLGGDETLKYFGLGGVSLYKSTVDVAGTSVSSNATGYNGGGGAIYNFSESFGLIGQVKYTSNGAGGIEPSLGLNFKF
jgi:hypothetical protein